MNLPDQELNALAKKAQESLMNSSFLQLKNRIAANFTSNEPFSLNLIMYRLALIDSIYATQMNKRMLGLETLAHQLFQFGSDESLKVKSLKLLDEDGNDSEMTSLFTKTYGIGKNAESKGLASSLISKYLYFLHGFGFPIYDSLACNAYNFLNPDNKLPTSFSTSYFFRLNNFKNDHKIESLDLLDMLLWTIGKILIGSVSIFIKGFSSEEKMENYQLLFKELLHNNDEPKSTEINLSICEWLRNEPISMNNYLEPAAVHLIKFVNAVKENKLI